MNYQNLEKVNNPKKAIDALKEVNSLKNQDSSGEEQVEGKKKSDKDFSSLVKKVAKKKIEEEGEAKQKKE